MTTALKPPRPRCRQKPPAVPEHPLQKQLADVLRIEIAPPGKVSRQGVVWWAIDHAAYSGDVPAIRVGRGIVAGVQDLFILYRGRAHHPEIKIQDGRLSDEQQSLCAAVLAAGGRVGVVRTADELLICIDEWNIPRAHRIKIQSP